MKKLPRKTPITRSIFTMGLITMVLLNIGGCKKQSELEPETDIEQLKKEIQDLKEKQTPTPTPTNKADTVLDKVQQEVVDLKQKKKTAKLHAKQQKQQLKLRLKTKIETLRQEYKTKKQTLSTRLTNCANEMKQELNQKIEHLWEKIADLEQTTAAIDLTPTHSTEEDDGTDQDDLPSVEPAVPLTPNKVPQLSAATSPATLLSSRLQVLEKNEKELQQYQQELAALIIQLENTKGTPEEHKQKQNRRCFLEGLIKKMENMIRGYKAKEDKTDN